MRNIITGKIEPKVQAYTPGTPPVITSSLTTGGGAGTFISYQIIATNNPTSYGAVSLPSYLSLDPATGIISGTPTSTGTTEATISASNIFGTDSEQLTIIITNFTPTPSAYTKLLMHFDSGFSDSSLSAHVATNNGVVIDHESYVFGGGSADFDSSLGYYLTLPYSSDFVFTGDFTIDFRFKFHSLGGAYHHLLSTGDESSQGWVVYTQDGTQLQFRYNNGSSVNIISASFSFDTGVFYYIKISCVSGLVYLFVNGICLNPGGTALDGSIYNPEKDFWIGSWNPGGGNLDCNGEMDELRILNGLGDAITDFTPPSMPYIVV